MIMRPNPQVVCGEPHTVVATQNQSAVADPGGKEPGHPMFSCRGDKADDILDGSPQSAVGRQIRKCRVRPTHLHSQASDQKRGRRREGKESIRGSRSENMRALATGGARALVDQEHSVRVLDNLTTGRKREPHRGIM